MDDRVRRWVELARRAIDGVPRRLVDCELCQARNVGRADRTVCLHPDRW